jgi:hypothetical protein
MTDELQKDLQGSGCVLVEVLSQKTTKVTEDSWCSGRDSNRTLLEYEPRVLTLYATEVSSF